MSRPKAEMSVEQKENGQIVEYVAYPYVEYDHVTMENGMDIMSMIRDDVSTPLVTHDTSSWKAGQGDSDVSDSIVDSSIASMTIKGQTYQNILPSPTLRNSMTDGKTVQKINEGYDSVEVVDKEFKSAILKGQTLVNLLGNYPEQTFTLDNTWQQRSIPIEYTNLIKPNTTYTFVFNVTECQMADSTKSNLQIGDDHVFNNMVNLNLKLGVNTYKLTTKDSITFPLKLYGSAYNSGTLTFNLMLLEGDYVGQNIPYFTGMQSVKMPVLTTCGKNLYPSNNSLDYNTVIKHYLLENYFESNSQYVTQATFELTTKNGKWTPIIGYEYTDGSISEQYMSLHEEIQVGDVVTNSFASQKGKSVSKIYIRSPWGVYGVFSNIQIEKGTTATQYEPYKTNILTTPQDLVLRGIGDVKDTLDCNTGELTQRIGEIVLDGSENWVFGRDTTHATNGRVFGFKIQIPNLYATKWDGTKADTIVCDKLKVTSQFNQFTGEVYNSISQCSPTEIQIMIKAINDSLNDTLNELKRMLSESPVTVIYPANDVIKTVDLSILNQDNQPVEQLQSYANGHIQLSSNVAEGEYSLTPSIEYEVPTSNSYYVDLAKPSTQYTMKNMQGTFTIDGTQYNASANGTFTTPSTLTNKFMVTSVAQSQPMLLEGDMTSEEVPYVEGIKSAFEGVDKVEIVSQNADNTLTNTTSFPITNPLRSLPNGVRDEIVLDRMSNKAKLIQRVGEDLTQLPSPIITEVNMEGYPYVYKDGHIFLNTEIAPTTEVKYSINQSQIIESQSEDIVRHSKEIDNLYNLIATYVQVNYDSTLLNLKTKGV